MTQNYTPLNINKKISPKPIILFSLIGILSLALITLLSALVIKRTYTSQETKAISTVSTTAVSITQPDSPQTAKVLPSVFVPPTNIKKVINPATSVGSVSPTIKGTIEPKKTFQKKYYVDGSAFNLILSYQAKNDKGTFSITSPDGKMYTAEYAKAHPNEVTFQSEVTSDQTLVAVMISSPTKGQWTLNLTAGADPISYILTTTIADGSKTLSASLDNRVYKQADKNIIASASINDNSQANIINIFLTHLDGKEESFPMKNEKGQYQAVIPVPPKPGAYLYTVNTEGETFALSASGSFFVSPEESLFSGQFNEEVIDNDKDGVIDSIRITAGVDHLKKGPENNELTFAGTIHLGEYDDIYGTYKIKEHPSLGHSIMTVDFSKEDFLKINHDGPYDIDLTLIGYPTNSNDEVIYTTKPYKLCQFKKC